MHITQIWTSNWIHRFSIRALRKRLCIKVHNIGSGDLFLLPWHCYCAEELCETNAESVIGKVLPSLPILHMRLYEEILRKKLSIASTRCQCPWIYIRIQSASADQRNAQNGITVLFRTTVSKCVTTLLAKVSDCKIIFSTYALKTFFTIDQ